MLNFQPVRDQQMTINDLVAGLNKDDLRRLTNDMIDTMQGMIRESSDADVIFEPLDSKANDTFASNPDEVNISWTLGHLIVHVTASSEESAAIATELARGVEFHGRSRYETPWQNVTSIAQCRQRLEESRRMRLASLDVWPDEPHLENRYQPWPSSPALNAVSRFVSGLRHDDDHVAQIADVVQQAKAAR